jgi:hypothetical protein
LTQNCVRELSSSFMVGNGSKHTEILSTANARE